MSRRKEVRNFITAPECRAKAVSLRTISAFASSAAAKANLLRMASEWEAQAEAWEAPG
jgi:hypothetical protein